MRRRRRRRTNQISHAKMNLQNWEKLCFGRASSTEPICFIAHTFHFIEPIDTQRWCLMPLNCIWTINTIWRRFFSYFEWLLGPVGWYWIVGRFALSLISHFVSIRSARYLTDNIKLVSSPPIPLFLYCYQISGLFCCWRDTLLLLQNWSGWCTSVRPDHHRGCESQQSWTNWRVHDAWSQIE